MADANHTRNGASRDSDKFISRLPVGMRDRIKVAAAINRRSMNSEIILRLQAFNGDVPQRIFENAGADADHFIIRLPPGMREALKEEAHRSHRSMNSLVVARLEESFIVAGDALHGSPRSTDHFQPSGRLRLEFEIWYASSGLAEERNWRERMESGEYLINYTETAWRAWKAARGVA